VGEKNGWTEGKRESAVEEEREVQSGKEGGCRRRRVGKGGERSSQRIASSLYSVMLVE
jgi:hypothetical protein